MAFWMMSLEEKKVNQQVKNKSKGPEEITDRRVGDGRMRMISKGKDQCWIKIRRRLPCDYQDVKHYY